MKLLAIDVYGKMAHFRKFYTNSSSLSYYFPPRTVLAGMLAGLLGYHRDSYYDIFSDKATFSLQILTPLRKKMNVVNYLFVKGYRDLTGVQGGTQIPLEIVLPTREFEHIVYRIFFSHSVENIYESAKELLSKGKYKYPLYFGITEMPAFYKFVGEFETEVVHADYPVEIMSVIPTDAITDTRQIFSSGNENVFVDKMPRIFSPDRILTQAKDYVFRVDSKPMTLKINESLFVGTLNYHIVNM
ncbi:MAG: CRISPR-associated protein Cas5 [Fervidobacterium sp.]|uniref:CRISPR-associated protein Cas5 n=1 Tax=Fervidobacterium sp. TaxID=1871331 RepID=UPI00404B5AE7